MPRTGYEGYEPKPRNDAYTILMVISLLAMIAACVIMFFELRKYPPDKLVAPENYAPKPPAGRPLR
ncbi:MAG: hypothetical protein RMI91_02345 [Gemmatales bacterium]|nr:hypothetical protein [Gemmatales bacterium]MDW7993468.1 hypothetical protein [Gemmatales bacterium]